jgi:5-methylcytosine-specific restriction endonuclease McrA
MGHDWWQKLLSLEAYIGVVISPTKFADSEQELFKLVHFIYWIAPPAGMDIADAVPFMQSAIDAIPRNKRKVLQRNARAKLAGRDRLAVRALVYGSGDTESANFYKSWEWRTLRMRILKHYGQRCQCCGATPANFDSAGNPIRIVVDHIRPISKFWDLRLDPSNLQVLCDECNQGNGAWDQTDHRLGVQ